MWTDERGELLKKLWAEGLSASQIAVELGGITRNAVIGKVHRLGLVPRVITVKPAPRRNVFEFTGPVCMWPHGHPGDDDFHFCGARPEPGRPYCVAHAAIAYIHPKEQPKPQEA